MKELNKILDEIEARANAATEGLSFVVNDKKDNFLSRGAKQMQSCLEISKKDIPKLVEALRVAVHYIDFINENIHDNLALTTLKQIESIMNGEGDAN